MKKLKDVLLGSLGVFGYILYLLITLIYAGLPAWVVIGQYVHNIFLEILIFIVFYIFCSIFQLAGGIACQILWIWGLVIAIRHFPIWFAIVYGILFIITVIRFFMTMFSNRK